MSNYDELLGLLREGETSTEEVAVAQTSVESTSALVEEDSSPEVLPESVDTEQVVEAEKEDDEEEDEKDSSEDKEEDEEDAKDKDDKHFNEVACNISLSEDEINEVLKQTSAEDVPEPEQAADQLPGENELTDDQKVQIRRLFDHHVLEAINARLAKAVRLAEQKLNEKYEADRLVRESEFVTYANKYLKYAVESWIEKNQVQIRTNTQVKVAQKIFESVRSLVEMYDIETADVKAEIVESYESKLAQLKQQANDLVSENARLVSEVEIRNKALIIEEAAKGIPLTEVKAFRSVVAKIKTDDLDSFKQSVSEVRESFLHTSTPTVEKIESLSESVAVQGGLQKAKPVAAKTEADFLASMLSRKQ